MFSRMIGELIVRKNSSWNHVASHNWILTSLPATAQRFVAAVISMTLTIVTVIRILGFDKASVSIVNITHLIAPVSIEQS